MHKTICMYGHQEQQEDALRLGLNSKKVSSSLKNKTKLFLGAAKKRMWEMLERPIVIQVMDWLLQYCQQAVDIYFYLSNN